MPDTAEHRAEMHRLATARRNVGKPVWEHKISVADVFHNEAMTFEERRDAIAARLRASAWFEAKDETDDLPMYVEELSEARTAIEFDSAWSAIYDEADYDRVWIATR